MQTEENNAQPPSLSSNQLVFLVLIFIAGFLFRWISLDARPVHHDESLHLMYGRYFFDWPDHQYYKYSAMLHGPLLYNALRAVYDTFGSSTWSGRAFTALLGSLFMFTPFYFRRYFSSWALISLVAAISLSPSLIYWSRFIREDTLQMLFMAITVIGAVACKGSAKAYVVMLGVVLQFCEKENSYVSLALLIGFVIFEFLLGILSNKWTIFNVEVKDTIFSRSINYIKEYWIHTIISFALGSLIYAYFYSAGFRHPDGILDGLYRESLLYWLNQHSIERIVGPFLFHFYTLNWYETIFTVLIFIHLFVFYKKSPRIILWSAISILGLSSILALFEMSRFGKTDPIFEKLPPWTWFNLKRPVEIVALFVFLIQPVIASALHLARKERGLAFWGYYFWASFFTYSYLGEKVPWLSVYVLLPGIVYLTMFFDRYISLDNYKALQNVSVGGFMRWSGVVVCAIGIIFVLQNKEPETVSGNNALTLFAGVGLVLFGYLDSWLKIYGNFNLLRMIAVLSTLYTLRLAYMTNFTHAGSEVEYFSQVHTTKRFHNFILDVRKQAETPTRNGVKPNILSEGESVWPVTWYLVDIPQYKFSATEEERKNFDFIFEDHKPGKAVPEGFCAEVMPLRSWYVPDWDNVTLKGYLVYTFNRRPWSGTGSSYVTALVKNSEWGKCPRFVPNGPS